jgi:hypothetical protein
MVTRKAGVEKIISDYPHAYVGQSGIQALHEPKHTVIRHVFPVLIPGNVRYMVVGTAMFFIAVAAQILVYQAFECARRFLKSDPGLKTILCCLNMNPN